MKFKVTSFQRDKLVLIPVILGIAVISYNTSLAIFSLSLFILVACYHLARIAAREVIKEEQKDKS